MRIGIDARTLGRGEVGLGVYTRQLVGRLSESAPDWEFVLYGTRPLDAPAPGGANVRLSPLGLPWGRKIGNLVFEQHLLPVAVERDRCDLLWSPAFVLPLRRTTPQVVTIHDLIPFHFARSLTLPRRLVYNPLLRMNARDADRIITVSESSAADLRRTLGVDPTKIRVIPNGRDERFTPLRGGEVPRLDRLLDELRIEPPYLLFTGGLLPRKNVHGLLSAFARAIAWDRGHHLQSLVLTGKLDHGGNKSYVDRLRVLARRHGIEERVRFTGFRSREELRLLYGGAAMTADLSYHEGFGFPVLEAISCGCPVVVSSRSSLPEVAGDAALLADPDSINEMALAIEKISGDPQLRDDLRRRGLARARAFSWERSALQTLEVFGELLGGTRSTRRLAA